MSVSVSVNSFFTEPIEIKVKGLEIILSTVEVNSKIITTEDIIQDCGNSLKSWFKKELAFAKNLQNNNKKNSYSTKIKKGIVQFFINKLQIVFEDLSVKFLHEDKIKPFEIKISLKSFKLISTSQEDTNLKQQQIENYPKENNQQLSHKSAIIEDLDVYAYYKKEQDDIEKFRLINFGIELKLQINNNPTKNEPEYKIKLSIVKNALQVHYKQIHLFIILSNYFKEYSKQLKYLKNHLLNRPQTKIQDTLDILKELKLKKKLSQDEKYESTNDDEIQKAELTNRAVVIRWWKWSIITVMKQNFFRRQDDKKKLYIGILNTNEIKKMNQYI